MHVGQPEKPATKARDREKRTTTAPPLYEVYHGIPFCINICHGNDAAAWGQGIGSYTTA